MKRRILLVGGGTAGHVEPALAVGKWLGRHSGDGIVFECEFLGTKSGLERELVPSAGFKLNTITRAPLPRKLDVAALIWPVRFTFSVLQSLSLVKKFDLIIGFGGYVSAPAYLAAWILRVPIIIHEANAKPGWANTLGSRFSKVNTVAFKSALSIGGNWRTAIVVGMPIREEIRTVSALGKSEIAALKSKICSEMNLNTGAPIVFAFGGSQGSTSMNAAISGLISTLPKLGLNLIQVVGKANALPSAVAGFAPLAYATNMNELYAISDLVIARSGAVTCAELMAAGKFALLVPLPIGNGEQVANAQDLVAAKQAEICDNSRFTSEWLNSNILRLLGSAQALAQTQSGNKNLEPKSAEQQLGEMALTLLSGTKK